MSFPRAASMKFDARIHTDFNGSKTTFCEKTTEMRRTFRARAIEAPLSTSNPSTSVAIRASNVIEAATKIDRK